MRLLSIYRFLTSSSPIKQRQYGEQADNSLVMSLSKARNGMSLTLCG